MNTGHPARFSFLPAKEPAAHKKALVFGPSVPVVHQVDVVSIEPTGSPSGAGLAVVMRDDPQYNADDCHYDGP
ncbi:hypothetical protein BN2476_10058 [Paraburkholderia piptadeniae]|uniref:Uncharacterized protein n=1 Tax=Paraburkholderia piptadeniae TaxID=1701573 RepID=A0A1N7RIU4_9BURK|nr:hypothetical protein BN2476_10058 [Paraburkholderia piptadeniae]